MIKTKQILAFALLLTFALGLGSVPVCAEESAISLVRDVSVFATDFDTETQVYLYSTFNVNRGDKGSVVYSFAASPDNNDGSAKDGQSVLSVLNEGKTSYPRTEVILDTACDYSTGYYKLSYSFFLEKNHMTNHLLMLRQSKNDIPLLSVNESGKYVASSTELEADCELNKWHTAEIIISMADTEKPQTFTVYADGELLAENIALGRAEFDKLTAYHFNANAQAASVYLDDISFDKLKISEGEDEQDSQEPEEDIKTDIEIPGELPDIGGYVVRTDIFGTDFDKESDDYLSKVFNVYGGDKGNVVYAFSNSPENNDGSEKSGMSIRSALESGKASYPRANVYFDRGYDSGIYHLKYTFRLEKNHIINNLVMLRQGTADVPLLTVGEDGSFQTAEKRLGYECVLGKWYDVDILIYLAGTDSPNTFDIYINGNGAAAGCRLSRTSFNRITAYLHNDNLLEAVSYLDDISLKEIVPNPGVPTVNGVTSGGGNLNAVPVENTEITLEFSHEIDIEGLKPDITVTDSDSNSYECSLSLSADRKALSLSFDDNLIMAKDYTLTVANIKDIYGNVMEDSFTADFKTQSEGFALGKVILTDETGNAPEAIPAEKLNASLTVQNMTEAENGTCIIAAVIKPNGKVRAFAVNDAKISVGEIRRLSLTLDTGLAQEGDIIRIFIWDGFDTMNSLGEYIEIN